MATLLAIGAAAAAQPPVQPIMISPRSGIVPVAVFGQDDRTFPPPQYASIKTKIGLLYNTNAKTVCTAFCLGPRLVATAAHCVFRTSGGEKLPKLADFVVAMPRGNDRELSTIEGALNSAAPQNVISGSTEIRVRPPIDAASDWALLRLASPICPGALPVKVLPIEEIVAKARAGKVFQLSYHRDYPDWRLAYSTPCEVEQDFKGAPKWSTIKSDFSNPQSLILHRCDTGGASSGGPIFMDDANGPVVIGINVGTYVQSRVVLKDPVPLRKPKQEMVANTAVNAAVFAPLIDAFRDAKVIESTERLRTLQERLAALKHYTGPLDGAYGPKLKSAIQDFERQRGLPLTGFATESLLRLTNDAAASLPTSAPLTRGTPQPRQSRQPAPPLSPQ